MGEVCHKRKIAFPGRLAIYVLHEISSQAEMMDPDFSQLCRALFEKKFLPFLASIGLESHQSDAHVPGVIDDRLDLLARNRLQEFDIVNSICALKPSVVLDNVSIKGPVTPLSFIHPSHSCCA